MLMMHNVSISLILIFISLFKVNGDLSTSSRLLNFIPVSPSRETIINAIGLKKIPIEVDGAFRSQVSIFAFSDPVKPQITFMCRVANLSNADPILEHHVCRREIKSDGTLEKETCQLASNGKHAFAQFKTTLSTNGLNLTQDTSTDPTDGKFKLTGSYSCLLKNRYGSSRSNWFRLTDVTEKLKAIREANRVNCREITEKIVNPIEPVELPYRFKCCQKTFHIDIESLQQPQYGTIFSWKACRSTSGSGVTSSECASNDVSNVEEVRLQDIGDHVISQTGDLVFLSFKSKPTPSYVNLLCYSRDLTGEEHSYYGKDGQPSTTPLTINSEGSKYTGPIQIQSLALQKIVFEPRKVTVQGFAYVLLALYKAPETVSFEWKKDDLPIPDTFKRDRFRLTFPDIVDVSLQGMYSLWLDGTSYFQYNVSIMTVPYFVNEKEMMEEKFVINGESVNITYQLSHPGDKKTVYINGHDIGFDGTNEIGQLLMKSNVQQIQYLKRLNAHLITLDGLSFANSTHLEYRVINMLDSGKGDQCQSHTFTLGVENAYGESHINSVIKVLPYPTASEYPDKYSCKKAKCYPNMNITISCKFPMHLFRQEGAYPRLLWYLDGKLLGSEISNFSIDSNSTDVWKMSFDVERETLFITNVSKSISISNVTCRLLLLYPTAEKLIPFSVDNFTDYQHLVIFDSDSNTYVDREKMTAWILFDEPKVGNITWIIALVVVLIILIVITIILICYCRNREPKETYNVDDEERKQGHNPLKEIREKEEFHDYEREEEGHLFPGSPPPVIGGTNYHSSERLAGPDSTLRSNGTTSREPRVTYRRTASVEDEI